MPPPLIVDISNIDLNQVVFDAAEIERVNPHRFEMRHLDGIIWHDPTTASVVGFKDVTEKEFWVRGHIPGRPLMPGVIMLEAAAQLASFYIRYFNRMSEDRFVGLGGIDEAKFRGAISPPARLILLGRLIENRSRRFVCAAQGLVNGVQVFEAKITGMPV